MSARKPKRVQLDAEQAAEYFVGGITGCLAIADRLGLSASVGAALMSALSMALAQNKLPVGGVIAAYRKLRGDKDMPKRLAKMLAAAAKAKPERRRLH